MGTLNDASSWATSICRGTRGLRADRSERPQPERLLELYEFETCPFSRKVREVLSELDLEYRSLPCPRGSARRDALRARGGKVQVPYLVDPNTGIEMYESEEIITYLRDRYGGGRSRSSVLLAPINTATSVLASLVRPRRGRIAVSAAGRVAPAQVLELYNFEASPYCRKAREALCRHDLEYIVHNVAKRSARRPELVARGGKMLVPYLIDPNTGVEMYESDDIVAYLDRTYG